MKASEVIKKIKELMEETKSDPEVLSQSHGCCYHGHEIDTIEIGGTYMNVTADEEGKIVIRV